MKWDSFSPRGGAVVGRRLRGRLSGITGVSISHSETPKRMLEREQ